MVSTFGVLITLMSPITNRNGVTVRSRRQKRTALPSSLSLASQKVRLNCFVTVLASICSTRYLQITTLIGVDVVDLIGWNTKSSINHRVIRSYVCRATRHQVQSPTAGKERISIAYFFNPRLDAILTPLDLPPAFAARASGGQNRDPNDPVFVTFGENTLKIRMRAHPDVTQAHYPNVSLGNPSLGNPSLGKPSLGKPSLGKPSRSLDQ